MFCRIYSFSLNIWYLRPVIRSRRSFWRAAIFLCCVHGQQAAAQDIGKLYAARPPAGYAFVRVALADNSAPRGAVQIASSEALIDDHAVATHYRAVMGNKPVRISIDGSVIDDGKIIPGADQFSTVVIARNGSGWTSYVIDEGQGNFSDLKAQLRFFNLVPRCEASLGIVDGPVIFDATATGNVRSRAINPVQARLEGSCNGRNAVFTLPQLHSGDHFSIFLTERAEGALSLSGQFDETEPYKGP